MRIWRRILQAASRSPRGYVADGRTLGLGLATAMEKSRQDTADVEAFLRDRAGTPIQVGGRL